MINQQFIKKHGLWNHPLYKTWDGMMARCYRSNTNQYENYGGRGIKVCSSWHNVTNFVADMGYRPTGYQLNRKDNDADYSPDNCEWASRRDQMQNRAPRQRNSSTEMKGISFVQPRGYAVPVYRVTKQRDHKRVHLGNYKTFNEAKKVLTEWLKEESAENK